MPPSHLEEAIARIAKPGRVLGLGQREPRRDETVAGATPQKQRLRVLPQRDA